MPELPEVETTLRGIEPLAKDAIITNFVVRNASLRWPVPTRALNRLMGQQIVDLQRRAKYILLTTGKGTVLLHLGMSGSLRTLPVDTAPAKHDHIDIELNGSHVIRLNDPRRFGCCLLIEPPVDEHKLLCSLGPEPLTDEFDGEVLFKRSRGRGLAVKNFIMDGKIVVGVGNIYASEALFLAGIRPTMAAKRISRRRYDELANTIKQVLGNAIIAGGTTLNDFNQVDGQPGYFSQELQVYGRAGEACRKCSEEIRSIVIGQRSTFFCRNCQSF